MGKTGNFMLCVHNNLNFFFKLGLSQYTIRHNGHTYCAMEMLVCEEFTYNGRKVGYVKQGRDQAKSPRKDTFGR